MAITTKNSSMKLEYIAEATRGTPTSSGTLQIPSDAVRNVSLTGTNNGDIIYTISDYDGQDTGYGLKEYTLSFEYDLQRHESAGGANKNTLATSLEYYALTRSSGLLTPLTFYLATDSTTRYVIKGGVINTFAVNTAPGERVHCSVEVSAVSVIVEAGNYGSLTASAAYGNTFETFQGASVTRTGSFDNGCGNFSFSINNNVTGVPNIGSSVYAAMYEGLENVEGSVDVILNDGGNSDWEEMAPTSGSPTEQAIVFNSGTSTTAGNLSMTWTFANAHYTNLPIDFSAEDGFLTSGVGWKAESVSLAVYS